MKIKFTKRLVSLLLVALMMLPMMMPLMVIFAEGDMTYVLNCDSLKPVSAGSKKDGDTDTGGTDNFFTIHYSSKTKIDGSKKDFADGFHVEQRINFGGKLDISGTPMNCLSFTTQGPATVKIWWVSGGARREFGIYDESGNLVTQTWEIAEASNALYISELTIPSEGKYYLGGIEGNNYIFKVAVTTKELDKGPRADWSTVSAPSFASVTTNEAGQLEVTVNGFVDHNGADYLTVNLLKDGNVVSTAKSTSVKESHTLLFSPVASGEYSLEAILVREGEENKVSEIYDCSYKLPLIAPYVTNVTNLGGGNTRIVWNAVREAESYLVSLNGAQANSQTEREITFENLSIGKHTIQITAVSGNRQTAAEPIEFEVTANAEIGWNYVIYGPSAKPSNNSYRVNEDGSVSLESGDLAGDNAGKLQPTGADGLGFYYTAVPSDMNFTFRAKVYVDAWAFTNGQEGFGLMVTDHVPSMDYHAGDFWTNQFQAVSTKIEYRYEVTEEGDYFINTNASGIGTKYTMKLGVGAISKIGIDQSILDRTALGETGLIVGQNGYLKTVMQSLERTAGFCNKETGSYNIIGNYVGAAPEGTFTGDQERFIVTELDLEIQKNNTGYFITYYDKNGNVVRQIKNYDHDSLEKFDSEYIYVGMFAARAAHVTFSDISLDLISEADDLPAEERPIEYIKPTVTITSTNAISSTNYELVADTNVDGLLEVRINTKTVIKDLPIKKYERVTKLLDLTEFVKLGENDLQVIFRPDKDQAMDPYTELESTAAVYHIDILTFFKGSYHTKTIYVSPTGVYNGNGTRENPYDIYTAVNRVIPGQTIVLMEGTYILKTGLRIQRGMNGTEEAPIRMIADPEATTRPVLDFAHEGTGITHGGNWWHFYGFDVTNTLDSYKGFQISGNNNIVENLHTYRNGNTGIQISRYHVADLYKDQWPANNLVLNCTSYGNADKGYEDADGFAAKLTIGEGNVFDGCIAYNNADDGWDLFAKVATGSIGMVVIKNSIAYGNGYLEDGTLAGNGNGFKLGGDSLSGHHQLINCIAFNNKLKGIDSNSCPDIYVENCISYNNGSYNVAFYTNNSQISTDFAAKGLISFKDESIKLTHPQIENALDEGDNLKPKNSQDISKYLTSTCYYWHGVNSSNDTGAQITADMFVSLEFTGWTRNEDGSIDLHGFLELKDNAPAGVGTTGAYTPFNVLTLEADMEHKLEKWTSDDYQVHWHECECGFRGEVAPHTFETVIDKIPTQTESGQKHEECTVCGFKMPRQEIPALGGGNAGNNGNTDVGTNAPAQQGGILGFFQMIWNAILNFFKSIFGLR